MKALFVEIIGTGERLRIEKPVWITKNRNGIIRTPYRVHALGVGDGETFWSLGALDGYPEAKLITRAEYEETLTQQDADPELTAEEALEIIIGGSV